MSPFTSAAALLLAALVITPMGAAAAPRIVIDPGHGGEKEGAVGATGLREKDLALDFSRLLRKRLEDSLGAQVLLTRESDRRVPLAERVSYANEKRPDLFISVHANSMPTRKQRERTEGIETYFLSTSASGEDARNTADRENAEGPIVKKAHEGDLLAVILEDLVRVEAHQDSSRLAYSVHQRLIAATGAVDRGVQQAPFYVLTGVEAPAILVEVGFITHPKEGERLQKAEYQALLAKAIVEGVQKFLATTKARDSRSTVAAEQP